MFGEEVLGSNSVIEFYFSSYKRKNSSLNKSNGLRVFKAKCTGIELSFRGKSDGEGIKDMDEDEREDMILIELEPTAIKIDYGIIMDHDEKLLKQCESGLTQTIRH